MRSKNKKFQVGDVIVPIPGKTQSAYWKLHNLKKAEVVYIDSAGYSMQIRIIEGSSYNNSNGLNAFENDILWVRGVAFQLETLKVDSYEIF